MKLALIGYGRMGQMVEACAAQQPDLSVCGIVDEGYLASLESVKNPDVAIDFSFPGDMEGVLAIAARRAIPLVIGRTGLTAAEEALILMAARRVPIVWSSNFSPGVAVMRRVAQIMTEALGGAYDIEIVEAHHRNKADAPSGTANLLLAAVNPDGGHPVVYGRAGVTQRQPGEIGVHTLRGGTVCGEHSVLFYGEDEELSLTHRAQSRAIFARGALLAARFAVTQPPGLYTMEQVLFGTAEDAAPTPVYH